MVFLILICLVVLSSSCTSHQKIKLVYNFDNVFDRNGRVTGYSFDKSKRMVINFVQANTMNEWLSFSPERRIDSIIKSNPDWQFVFYCYGRKADTLRVIRMLNRFNCNFPVIFDFTNEFAKKNFSAPIDRIALIGYICNKNGKIYGMGPMGDPRSMFDVEFRKAKRIISH